MTRRTQISLKALMESFLVEAKSEFRDEFDQIYRDIEKERKYKSDQEKFLLFKLGAEQLAFKKKSEAEGGGSEGGSRTAPRGSSRMVFDIGKDYVLKVALNEAGFAQNGIEATIGMDDEVSEIVAPIVDKSDVTDYNGFLWIMPQKAIPLSDSIAGKEWPWFSKLLRKAATTTEPIVSNASTPEITRSVPPEQGPFSMSDASDLYFPSSSSKSGGTQVAIPQKAADEIRMKRQKEREEEDKKVEQQKKAASALLQGVDESFFDAFRAFLKKYKSSRTGDLFKPDSWGMVDGKLKLIDYGYTHRVSEDFYVGGYAGDTEQAKGSVLKRSQERFQNIKSTIADNIDTIENVKNIPPKATLPLLLRGLVAGMPREIETFAIGNPLEPLTATELAAAARAIRTNQGKVKSIIDQVTTNPGLKKKLYDELDDILLSTGSLNKKLRAEALVRAFVRRCMLRG